MKLGNATAYTILSGCLVKRGKRLYRGATTKRCYCSLAVAVFGLLQLAGPAISATVTVANPSFETVEPIQGYPSTFGDWGVDLSQIVTAQNGITPFDGT